LNVKSGSVLRAGGYSLAASGITEPRAAVPGQDLGKAKRRILL